MKYVLAILAAATLGTTASAQDNYDLRIVKVVRTAAIHPVENENESNMQAVLDRLQEESQNTVIYPLVKMSQLAFEKVEGLKKPKNHERIRTNNGKKKPANPNRA